MNIVERALPGALFLIFFFWQLFPIILASQGAFLDMRKLLVYPIPDSQLFLLETVLRVTTAIEMILVSGGLIAGLLLNPDVPFWSPLPILLFMTLNLLLATGIKSLLDRLFKKKGVRELMMVVFLGLILAPQFFAAGLQDGLAPQFSFLRRFAGVFQLLPWSAAADLALGKLSGLAVASLAASTAIAFVFPRLQFARSLLLDEGSGGAGRKAVSTEENWFDRVSRWPSLVLLDPLPRSLKKTFAVFPAPGVSALFSSSRVPSAPSSGCPRSCVVRMGGSRKTTSPWPRSTACWCLVKCFIGTCSGLNAPAPSSGS